jgi:hypothetical protein
MTLFRVLTSLLLTTFIAQASFAACEIYSDLEKPIKDTDPNRISCLRESHFLLPAPAKKTQAEIIMGEKTDGLPLEAQSRVYCRYFYRYQNGSSNKFRCARTNENNVMLSEKGEPVPEAAKVADAVFAGKLEEDILVRADGSVITKANAKGEIKAVAADVLKVRFKVSAEGMKNQTDLNEWRHREAYTSAVATRLAWMMGFPSENYYPVKEIVCFGCDTDPWKNGLEPQLVPVAKTNVFPGVSIERKFEGKRIIKAYTSNPKLGKKFVNTPWRWDEYISNFAKLTSQQQHEIQVLALFINLVHTVEERGTQHVLLCEKDNVVKSADGLKKICSEPIAGTHDLGSAFGNRDLKFVKNKNHPRGDYAAYKALNMFLDNKCTLSAQPGKGPNKNLPGLTTVTEQARREFVTRLDLVSREDLMTILQISNFSDVDMPFKNSVAKQTGLKGDALSQRVNEMWSDLIYSKMDQFRNTQCN